MNLSNLYSYILFDLIIIDIVVNKWFFLDVINMKRGVKRIGRSMSAIDKLIDAHKRSEVQKTRILS